MKYQFYIIGASIFLSAFAAGQQQQAKTVPPAVRKAYHARYNKGSAEWKSDSSRTYTAGFHEKGRVVKAKFDSTGTWVETASAIRRAKLTRPIRTVLGRDYKGYKVIETEKIVRPGSPKPIYEIHLANDREILQTQFDENGALLAKIVKPKTK